MFEPLKEALFWLQDVSEHLHVMQLRRYLRQPAKGFDYTRKGITTQALVTRIHPKRMQLRVVDVSQTTPSSKTFRFERIDGPIPPYRAGQYINLFVEVDGIQTSRPYSIASSPQDKFLILTVKDNPGGFVAPYLLNELGVGDIVETSGPAGSFYYEPLIDGNDLVFLAGGSGITPFMSIITDLLARMPHIKIHLLYGSRSTDDVIYGAELNELTVGHSNFDFSLVISEPPVGYDGLTGFLSADLISQQIGDLEGKTFYICGPHAMYDFCLASLADLGVPGYKIKRELYGPPIDVTQEPGWPEGVSAEAIFNVDFIGRDSIQALAGEPLLNTFERYGIVIPAECRVGECSLCRVRLLSGKVFMPENTGLRAADRQHGYIHSCVAFPLEDLQIRLPG